MITQYSTTTAGMSLFSKGTLNNSKKSNMAWVQSFSTQPALPMPSCRWHLEMLYSAGFMAARSAIMDLIL